MENSRCIIANNTTLLSTEYIWYVYHCVSNHCQLDYFSNTCSGLHQRKHHRSTSIVKINVKPCVGICEYASSLSWLHYFLSDCYIGCVLCKGQPMSGAKTKPSPNGCRPYKEKSLLYWCIWFRFTGEYTREWSSLREYTIQFDAVLSMWDDIFGSGNYFNNELRTGH